MQICVLQVNGASPVLRAYSCTYRLNCLHFEVWTREVHIQLGDIENRSVGPVGFGTKHAGIKLFMVKLRTRNAHYGPLLLKGRDLLQQTRTENQIVWQSEWNRTA